MRVLNLADKVFILAAPLRTLGTSRAGIGHGREALKPGLPFAP
jgi:hypothetical protein